MWPQVRKDTASPNLVLHPKPSVSGDDSRLIIAVTEFDSRLRDQASGMEVALGFLPRPAWVRFPAGAPSGCAGNGIQAGLRRQWSSDHAGSTPATRTMNLFSIPRWWNGRHGRLKSDCPWACRFDSDSGDHVGVVQPGETAGLNPVQYRFDPCRPHQQDRPTEDMMRARRRAR